MGSNLLFGPKVFNVSSKIYVILCNSANVDWILMAQYQIHSVTYFLDIRETTVSITMAKVSKN